MRPLVGICISICISTSEPALAQHKEVTVLVGGKVVVVPAPAGTYEVSDFSPATRQLAESTVHEGNRLLAVLVDEERVAELIAQETTPPRRYLMLQVNRESQTRHTTRSRFEELKEHLRTKFRGQLPDLVSAANQDSARLERLGTMVEVGEPAFLGVHAEGDAYVCFSMIMKVATEKREAVMATTTAMVHVRSRVLYAYVHSRYSGLADLIWTRDTAENWAKLLVGINQR